MRKSAAQVASNRLGWVLRVLFLTGVVAVALVGAAPRYTALANGDSVEIFRGSQGPYEIVVSIQPASPMVGTVHITVTPIDAATSEPLTQARITLVAHDGADAPVYQARAVNTPASPKYYDANISFESPGQWTLVVSVVTDDLGAATVRVPLDVAERPLPPALEGAIMLLVVIGAFVGGAAYLYFSSRRALRRREGRL